MKIIDNDKTIQICLDNQFELSETIRRMGGLMESICDSMLHLGERMDELEGELDDLVEGAE